jgi:hypothetical protein
MALIFTKREEQQGPSFRLASILGKVRPVVRLRRILEPCVSKSVRS